MATEQTGQDGLAQPRKLDEGVWSALRRGDRKKAVAACRTLNQAFPGYAPGWHTASHLALMLNQPEAGLQAISKAVELEPGKAPWLLQRGVCLARLNRIEPLDQTVRALRGLTLNTPYQLSTMGLLLTHLGRRQEALIYYRQAAELEPEQSRHFYNMACLERTLGHVESAEGHFDRTIELEPTDYEAWKIRSELRTQTTENNHVADLEQLLAGRFTHPHGRVQICYALAKELEDLEEWERSFDYLEQGARARRAGMRYEPDRDLATMDQIMATYDPGVFANAPPGSENEEAIFIIGMPRTGTTLVERVLGAHSDVFAAGELNHFTAQLMRQVLSRSGNKRPERNELVKLSSEVHFAKLGDAYIDSTRPQTGHTPRFTDKLPLNYLYAGPIHLALPRARIIHVQRHPLDTCYAVYKQLFVDAYPFSYDLEELGRYYAAYERLMAHWKDMIPGVIHTVRYEDLVADIEGETRKLLEYCGLDWQSRCLDFHASKEASMTASTVQVRRPVYSSSVGKWRRYERQLQPLIETLQAEGVKLDGA